MNLSALAAAVPTLAPEVRLRALQDVGPSPVTGVTHDSRLVAPGVVFVAIHGQRTRIP